MGGHAGYNCVRVFTRGTRLFGHCPVDSQSGCAVLARTGLHAPTAALERLSQAVDAVVGPAVGAHGSVLGRACLAEKLTPRNCRRWPSTGKRCAAHFRRRSSHPSVEYFGSGDGLYAEPNSSRRANQRSQNGFGIASRPGTPGRIVTGDAMFCQREVCQQVLQQQGHYLFVVKDNQPAPKEAIAAEFAADFSPGEPAATRKAS